MDRDIEKFEKYCSKFRSLSTSTYDFALLDSDLLRDNELHINLKMAVEIRRSALIS